MTRNLLNRCGHSTAALAALAVGFVALVGCGQDLATAPQGLSAADTEVGEFPLPDDTSGPGAPGAFKAQRFGQQA